jgi:hypothetical protein
MSSSLTAFACIENVDRVISSLYQLDKGDDTESGLEYYFLFLPFCVDVSCVLELFMLQVIVETFEKNVAREVASESSI